jgi:hypothetical protein
LHPILVQQRSQYLLDMGTVEEEGKKKMKED